MPNELMYFYTVLYTHVIWKDPRIYIYAIAVFVYRGATTEQKPYRVVETNKCNLKSDKL